MDTTNVMLLVIKKKRSSLFDQLFSEKVIFPKAFSPHSNSTHIEPKNDFAPISDCGFSEALLSRMLL